jgi:hypothetical protein
LSDQTSIFHFYLYKLIGLLIKFYLQIPLPVLHWFEQQFSPLEQGSTLKPQFEQSSSLGGSPQSYEQLHESSPWSQLPSPQKGSRPQSISQLKPSSLPSQTPSPQHDCSTDSMAHVLKLFQQRWSSQVTPYRALPSPQQYRPLGLPVRLPLQSLGQEMQSSPLAASQLPLPQLAAAPPWQSMGQL